MSFVHRTLRGCLIWLRPLMVLPSEVLRQPCHLCDKHVARPGMVMHLARQIAATVLGVCLSSSSLIAQITITAADVSAINAVGNSFTNHLDTTTTSINIGSPGATSWNFSALRSHFSSSLTSVNPAATPYISTFPTSNVVFRYKVLFEGDTAEVWQYSTQTSTQYTYNGGVVRLVSGSDEFLNRTVANPPQLFAPLPFTYNSQWNSNFAITNTLLVNGSPLSSTTANHTETVVVDAYGPMTMPGGSVIQALRLRRDDRYTSGGMSVRTISYTFLAKNGAAVEVTARDTTAPNSGVIPVSPGIVWRLGGAPVNVSDEGEIPSQFFLSQNYPNPFNPETRIRYALPVGAHVSLKLYNVLGQEAAVLVDAQQEAGWHEVRLSGATLPSGVYLYRLQAGAFTSTRKLLIIR